MTILDMKIKQYNLNLDYPYVDNVLVQTNNLINSIVNEFLNCYIDNKKINTFIIEYQDDLISIICYRMLKSLLNVANFNLLICGKHHKTKKLLDKKQKFISKHKMKKLHDKNNALIISVFNPLYNVVESQKNFDNFLNKWQPMKSFTPIEIEQAQIFYHIGYIKNDIYNDDRVKSFSDWTLAQDKDKFFGYDPTFVSSNYNNDKIHLIKLTNNLENNSKVLNEVEKEDGLFFYSLNVEPDHKEIVKQQLSEFAYYLKNKSNAYGHFNGDDVDIISIASALNVDIITHEYKEKDE